MLQTNIYLKFTKWPYFFNYKLFSVKFAIFDTMNLVSHPSTPCQVLSQFDANLSGDIPCCLITSSGEPPLWCGTECPGTAADSSSDQQSQAHNWTTTLAGLKLNEEKMRAGSLDNVGITLHNLLDEIQKYSVIHAVWITEQVGKIAIFLIYNQVIIINLTWFPT